MKTWLKVVFLAVASVCCATGLKSQDIKFKSLSRDRGLSNSVVQSVLEDYKGFLWVGTADGLNMFDGYTVKVFRHKLSDSSSVSSSYIIQVFEDSKKRLWIAAGNGLNLYDRKKGTFTFFKNLSIKSRLNNAAKCVFEDSQGRIWTGTAKGLALIDPSRREFKVNIATEAPVTCIAELKGTGLLAGTDGGGMLLINRGSKVLKYYQASGAKGKSVNSNYITCIEPDGRGGLLIGTKGKGLNTMSSQGIFSYYLHSDNDNYSLSGNVVKAIYCNKAGEAWIGTQNGGLNRFNLLTDKFYSYQAKMYDPESLSQNTVKCIVESRDRTLWIGTHGGGVNFYSPRSHLFKTVKAIDAPGSLSHNEVRSFLETAKDEIWVGTDGGGINIWNRRNNKFKTIRHEAGNQNSLSSNVILHLMKDSEQKIWISTWGGGLNQFDVSTGLFKHYLSIPGGEDALGSNNVLKTEEIGGGRLLLATYDAGINILDQPTGRFFRPEKADILGKNTVCIVQDVDNSVWIGTNDGGLNHWLPQKNKTSHFFSGVNYDGALRVLFKDSKNRIWAGAEGLYEYKRGSNRFLKMHTGTELDHDNVRGLLEDGHGNFWVSTNNGLYKVNSKTGRAWHFTVSDGLQGMEFSQNAALALNSGEMLFGGTNGFTYFHPDSIKRPTQKTPVYLRDFQIFNRSVVPGAEGSPLKQEISESNEIALSYNQSVFSIDYAAVNLVSEDKAQYRYRLLGFDKDWNYVGTQRKATYTNLDPGEYEFIVSASDDGHLWNARPAHLKITINPPIWMTWWFKLIVLVCLLTSCGTVLFYKRKRHLKRLDEEKQKEIQQIQRQFFINISHEFRTPLSLILGPVEQLQREAGEVYGEKLTLIHRNANRLMSLIGELINFEKAESGLMKLRASNIDLASFIRSTANEFMALALQKQIALQVEIVELPTDIWLDREIVEKIVLNLLDNAIKYSPEGSKVLLRVREGAAGFNKANENELHVNSGFQASGYICISVSDTGIGISAESIGHLFERYYRVDSTQPGSGIGLAFVKSLTMLHKGGIYVSSSEGKGTDITISLPYKKVDYKAEELCLRQAGANAPKMSAIPNDAVLKRKMKLRSTPGSNARRILITDDNAEIRNYLCGELREYFEIIEAVNGEEGLSKAKSYLPDLVISDVMMPKVDGIEFCRRIKADTDTSHIPVILLTAKDSTESCITGIESGADYYFSKTANIDILFLTINNIFIEKERLKDRFQRDYRVEVKELVSTQADEKFMEEIIRVIENNLLEPNLDVDYICKKIGINRFKLNNKLRSLTGQTTGEFIRSIRLKTAANILVHENVSVSEAMYRVGISSQSYFTSAFKKEFGKLPSEFLKEMASKG